MKRVTAAGLALAVLVALGLQFHLNGAKPGLEPWGARAWDLLRYFTILTNGLVGALMLREAMARPVGAHLLATAALNIAMVGIIFQLLLAPPEPPKGLDFWPDFLFHAAVPVAAVLWWLAFAPKSPRLADVPLWLAYPLAYCVYILIRAQFDGNYVYFFLDIAKFGPAAIALNILGLILVFAVFGALMVLAAKALAGRRAAV